MTSQELFIASFAILPLAGCEWEPNFDRTDGLKDAVDARPHEGVRDAAEDAGAAIKDAGGDLKDAVEGDGT